MSKEHRRFVESILSGRSAILELIMAGVLLAISVEFIAAWATAHTAADSLQTVVIGLLLLALTLLLWLRRSMAQTRQRHVKLDGFLIYLRKDNALVDVPRYRYGSTIHDYITAAFVENTALKTLWDKEPLTEAFMFDKEKGATLHKNNHSMQLVREATEYFVLDRLSTHLTDYFNTPEYNDDQLKKYSREDVPDILLKNRFLELFSRPMDQRPHFVNDTLGDMPHGQIVSSFGKGGVRYDRFDLVLPCSTRVARYEDGAIQIETKRFTLCFRVKFDATMTVLPRQFEEYYLGLKNHRELAEYRVSLEMDVTFRARSYFTATGWGYHRWVDSFMTSIEEDFCEDAFLEDLNWPVVQTLIEIFKQNRPNQGPDRTDAPPSGASAGQP
jgi:hypothetical protein